MKRIIILLAILLSASANFAQAQTGSSDSNYNFRFSPVGLILGLVGVSLDISVSPEWTLGPELSYAKFGITTGGASPTSLNVNLAALGARANWFKNGVYTDGLYVGPFARYATTSINATGSTTVTGETAGLAFGSVVGYGWFWNSFNMMLGGGAAFAAGESNLVVTESDGTRTEVPNRGVGLAAEFNLGWTF